MCDRQDGIAALSLQPMRQNVIEFEWSTLLGFPLVLIIIIVVIDHRDL